MPVAHRRRVPTTEVNSRGTGPWNRGVAEALAAIVAGGTAAPAVPAWAAGDARSADALDAARRNNPPLASGRAAGLAAQSASMTALSGKVAIVTGASRGIGKGCALELGAAGATVYVTGRTTKRGAHKLGGTVAETAAAVDIMRQQSLVRCSAVRVPSSKPRPAPCACLRSWR